MCSILVVNSGIITPREKSHTYHLTDSNRSHKHHNHYLNHSANVYNIERDNLIANETELRLGGKLIHNFTELELQVHRKILKYRQDELDFGIINSSANLAGLHFFEARAGIERSPIFKIIQKLPKGAALHGHNTAMVSSEWILKNLTYRDNVKMCKTSKFLLFSMK